MRLLTAVRRDIAQIGWRATVCYAFDRLLRATGLGTLHYYGFYAQPVRATKVPRGFSWRELANPADHATALALDMSVVEYRQSQSAVCVAAFHGDDLAAALWFCTGLYHEDEVRADFVPSPAGVCGWDFGVYVAEPYRLTRAFAAIWAGASAAMEQRGLAWTISRIALINTASVQAHKRLDAFEIGRAGFLRLGAVQIAVSSWPPRLHVSARPGYRPRYAIMAPGHRVQP